MLAHPKAIDPALDAAITDAVNNKTKPPGSLGRLEALAHQIARVQGRLDPQMNQCEAFLFAADHGIANDGVSAFPQAVTREMVKNFLAGGAGANVFAATNAIPLIVVDAGVAGDPIDHPALVSRRIGAGTASFLAGPAMSGAQRDEALAAGLSLAKDAVGEAVAFGEMGIGNTAAAAMLGHKLTGRCLDRLVGPGTGLDSDGISRKLKILQRAARRTDDTLSGTDALAEYGGFEIAMMAGAMLGGAGAGKIVLVDGFIATAAALAAVAIAPTTRDYMVFAHRSAEPGHTVLLKHLNAEPLLDLHLALGEGTGALLAWPLLKCAAAMLCDMASFESAGVSGPV
jgi:nicotinate-nucleotide--dimethylbenzimidazole phosphoribosyltransferase